MSNFLASDGKRYFSYSQIAATVSGSVPEVQAFAPDVFVAIGGGGFIPARMLRTEVQKPILAISLELYDDATKTANSSVICKQWFDEAPGTFGSLVRGRRVLIIDEVDDTRATLQFAVEELKRVNAPAAVGVYVVHNKAKPKTGSLPDDVTYIAGENVEDVWNCYPWDAAAYGQGIAEHEALARSCAEGGADGARKRPREAEPEGSDSAAPAGTGLSLSGLPALRWLGGVEGAASVEEGVLTMTAGARTDWFNPPPGEGMPSGLANAPCLVFSPPPGDWQLSARVEVEHRSLFDAGTLFVHQGPGDWCKCCYELSPEGKPLVVSVVTRGVSDDANGAAVEGGVVRLRISKLGAALAFHYAHEGGEAWTLTRIFCLREPSAPLSVGFLAQCPTGQACTATFSRVALTETTLRDPRDGS